jgi:hypothetical protein
VLLRFVFFFVFFLNLTCNFFEISLLYWLVLICFFLANGFHCLQVFMFFYLLSADLDGLLCSSMIPGSVYGASLMFYFIHTLGSLTFGSVGVYSAFQDKLYPKS